MSIFSFPVLPSKTDVYQNFCMLLGFLDVLMFKKIMSVIVPVCTGDGDHTNIQNIEKTFNTIEINPDMDPQYYLKHSLA